MTMSRSWIIHSIWLGFNIGLLICSESFSLSLNQIDINDFLRKERNMISKLQNYISLERDRLNQLKLLSPVMLLEGFHSYSIVASFPLSMTISFDLLILSTPSSRSIRLLFAIRHLQVWTEWRHSNTHQEAEYITIPQNLFHLFKRLTLDLDEIKKSTIESSYNNAMILNEIEPPTDDHLRQAILSLVDLQYQYNLEAEYIMNGILMGVKLNTPLTLDTCYFIGKTCWEYNNHQCVADWLMVCLWLSFETDTVTAQASRVTRFLCLSYMFLNMTKFAYECALNYLKEHDNFDTSFFHIAIETGSELDLLTGAYKIFAEGHRICREDHEKSTKSNLKCRYNSENSAFLKIAPLKEEELNDAPKILYYRDVLYDSEIEFIKNVSIENMTTALLHGSKNLRFSHRVTESAFIKTHLPPLRALENRAEDIFGTSIYFSESWQVLNYAPGGFYNTHNDYLSASENHAKQFGIRLTTMLFYMNDVTLGGETVFPRIGVSVKPTKGSVVVWHNIHADGSQNRLTDHSACPVIKGEKWGFTKWIRILKNQQCLRSIYESDKKIKSRSKTK